MANLAAGKSAQVRINAGQTLYVRGTANVFLSGGMPQLLNDGRIGPFSIEVVATIVAISDCTYSENYVSNGYEPEFLLSDDGAKFVGYKNPDESIASLVWPYPLASSMAPQAYQSYPGFSTGVSSTYGTVYWTEGEPYGYRLVASSSTASGTPQTYLYAVAAIPTYNGTLSNPTFPTFSNVRSPTFSLAATTNDRVDIVSDFMPFTPVARTDGYSGFLSIVLSRGTVAGQGNTFYQIINPSLGFPSTPADPSKPLIMSEATGDRVSDSTAVGTFRASASASAGIFAGLGYTEIQWYMKNRKSIRFLGGGDSNMVGEYTLTGYNNYARKIAQTFNSGAFAVDYCSVARGAAQSQYSYPMLKAKIIQYRPSVAFLQSFTGNDTCDATQVAASISRVFDFIDTCKTYNCIPVIMSCMPKNTRTGSEATQMGILRAQVAQICQYEGIIHVDAMGLLGDSADITTFATAYKGDGAGLHSNEAGHQLLSDAYAPYLKRYFPI